MTELAGFLAYGICVWAALTIYDARRNQSRVDAWKARAEHIRQMRGTP